MKKKVITFGMSGTLGVSSRPVSNRIAKQLDELLNFFEVCILTTDRFSDIEMRLLSHLNLNPKKLSKLHLLPSYGARYYRFDPKLNMWGVVYTTNLTNEQKATITTAIMAVTDSLGLNIEHTYGPIIEDRYTQITYSVLGRSAPIEKRYRWAESNAAIQQKLRRRLAQRLPDFTVQLSGLANVDVLLKEVNKAVSLKKFMRKNHLSPEQVVFVGDKLSRYGTDYPIKQTGVTCIEVGSYEDAIYVMRGMAAMRT